MFEQLITQPQVLGRVVDLLENPLSLGWDVCGIQHVGQALNFLVTVFHELLCVPDYRRRTMTRTDFPGVCGPRIMLRPVL
jgi:hypothetical protein